MEVEFVQTYCKDGVKLKVDNSQAINVLFRSKNIKPTESDQIIDRERYLIVRDTAINILINSKANELPIQPENVAKLCHVILSSYQNDREIVELIDLNNNRLAYEAFSCILNGQKVICYNSNYPYTRTRFTIMHELAHLILSHSLTMDYNAIEAEAHMLAARLLMPACILHACNVSNAQEIAALCQVSLKSATIRYNRYKEILSRNNIFTSEHEIVLLKQFEKFCDYYLINKERKYGENQSYR